MRCCYAGGLIKEPNVHYTLSSLFDVCALRIKSQSQSESEPEYGINELMIPKLIKCQHSNHTDGD